jgi:hypothetical protein
VVFVAWEEMTRSQFNSKMVVIQSVKNLELIEFRGNIDELSKIQMHKLHLALTT